MTALTLARILPRMIARTLARTMAQILALTLARILPRMIARTLARTMARKHQHASSAAREEECSLAPLRRRTVLRVNLIATPV